jgi:ATP-dependent protease HslVU (ClpYQ) peptidase subunit
MKSTEQKTIKKKDSEKSMAGSTAQIRDVVQKVESKIKSSTPDKRIRKILKVLKKKDKEEIKDAAPS